IVMSSISILLSLFFMALTAVQTQYSSGEYQPSTFDVTRDDMSFIIVGLCAVIIVGSVAAIRCAHHILKRRGSRRRLTVLSGLTMGLGTPFSFFILTGVPWLIAGGVVAILIYTRGASAWFAS